MDRLQPENDPASIERRSFAIIDTEAGDHKPFSGLCWEVARRLVHTTADFSILETLVVPEKAVAAGVVALRASCSVFTDTRMALAGIPKRRLEPLGVTATCLLSLPGVDERAKSHGTTLSCAALELAGDRIENTILAVGNAPTTLIAFIKYLRAGGPPPALVIGMPVGFVNAAESKELLLKEKTCPASSSAADGEALRSRPRQSTPWRKLPSAANGPHDCETHTWTSSCL